MGLAEKLKKVIYYAFLALVFVVPLSWEMKVPGFDAQLVFLTEPFCIIIIGLLAIYLILIKNTDWKFTLIDKLVVLHAFFILLSTLFSDDWMTSGKYTITIFWYIIAGYTVPRVMAFNRNQSMWILKAHVAGALVLCIYVLINFARLGIFYESSYQIAQPFIPVGHTNLSVVIEPPLFAVIALFFLSPKDKKHLIIYGGLMCLFLAVIYFSLSRSSYGIVLLCFLIFLSALPKQFRLKLVYIVGIPIVAAITIKFVNDYSHIQEVSQYENSHYNKGGATYDYEDKRTWKVTSMGDEIFNNGDSDIERLIRWEIGLDFYTESPILGVGMGTYPDKYLDYKKAKEELDETRLSELRMNIHNVYLGWLVEGGLFTFITGLGILVVVFFTFFQHLFKTKKNSILKIGVLTFFVSYTIHGFAHDFSQDPRVMIVFWTCLVVVNRVFQTGDLFKSQTENSEVI